MILDAENDRVFLKLGQPNKLLATLPGFAEPIKYKKHNVMVDLNPDTAKVLRNMGLKCPSIMGYKYDWPGKFTPLAHQIDTAEFMTLYRRGFVLNEMGTMKTASALWALDYMMCMGTIHKALIVAPLSTLEDVWLNEVFKVIMHRNAVILHGSAERRLALLKQDVDIYIINYEGLDIVRRAVRKRKDIDIVVVDEAAAYRNSQTDRYETLAATLRDDTRLMLMTGTPCPNAPTDAWALAKLVSPTSVPVFFTTWKRKVMQQVSTYKWVNREGSHEMAYSVMQPAVRYAKKDCLDLPLLTYERRATALSKEQQRAFKDMKNHMIAEAAGEQVSAINAADRLGKLRQILCGAVKHPVTGEYVTLDHAPRLAVLKECIEQASAKVLIIVPFKGITRVLAEELSDAGISNAVVNGDVTLKQRTEIFRQFRNEKHPHTLLCHPKVMAHGLTLTEADMMIFYAPIFSNEQAQQVVERINRPGQTRKMTIVQIAAHALEVAIYQQIEANRLTQESILDLYKRTLHSA